MTGLTTEERLALARFQPDKSKRLSGSEKERLYALRQRQKAGLSLSEREAIRLKALSDKEAAAFQTNQICRFRGSSSLCTKDGGVCSLRLYTSDGEGNTVPLEGERSKFRILDFINCVFLW